MKRSFDIIFSSTLLIALSPLLGLIALAIKLTSKGPVIYKQQRIGKDKKPFEIYKFRTMVPDAEKDGPRLAVIDDERITSLGKILRKYHLDELTQFWNVIKGDMTVVGPRPEREVYIEEILKHLPDYDKILSVKPGITSSGMIQCGYASTVEKLVNRAIVDLNYLENKKSRDDLKIIGKTIITIFKGKGL